MHSRLKSPTLIGTFGLAGALLWSLPVRADRNTPEEPPSRTAVTSDYQVRLTQLLRNLDQERAPQAAGTVSGVASGNLHFAPMDANNLASALRPTTGSVLVLLGARDRAGRLTIDRVLRIRPETTNTAHGNSHTSTHLERSAYALLNSGDALMLPSNWTQNPAASAPTGSQPPPESVTAAKAIEAISRPGTAAFVLAVDGSASTVTARTLAVVPDSLRIDIGGSPASTSTTIAATSAVASRSGGTGASMAIAPAVSTLATPVLADAEPAPADALPPAPALPNDRPHKHERSPEELRAEEQERQRSFVPPSATPPMPPINPPPPPR